MSLSIIVPTCGRASLKRTLLSISPQLEDGDEVIVVGDGPQPQAESICAEFGPCVEYLDGVISHCYGNRQRQQGMTLATGDYLMFCDDDDVLVPNALTIVRKSASLWPGRPMLFQFIDRNGLVLWQRPIVTQGNISTAQIVFPNRPEYLGNWGDRYEGDLDFIQSTLAKWPGGESVLVWRPNILADCRKAVAA